MRITAAVKVEGFKAIQVECVEEVHASPPPEKRARQDGSPSKAATSKAAMLAKPVDPATIPSTPTGLRNESLEPDQKKQKHDSHDHHPNEDEKKNDSSPHTESTEYDTKPWPVQWKASSSKEASSSSTWNRHAAQDSSSTWPDRNKPKWSDSSWTDEDSSSGWKERRKWSDSSW